MSYSMDYEIFNDKGVCKTASSTPVKLKSDFFLEIKFFCVQIPSLNLVFLEQPRLHYWNPIFTQSVNRCTLTDRIKSEPPNR